jgi:hypothetical protein
MRGSIPSTDQKFLLSKTSSPALVPTPTSHSMGKGVLSRKVKRPRREAGHLLPSSVEDGWSNTSTSPIRLHGVHRNYFTFTFALHLGDFHIGSPYGRQLRSGVWCLCHPSKCRPIRYCGHALAQLVEALRYKPEGRGFDFQWYHWHNPSSCTTARTSTQEYFLEGVKAAGG